MYKRIIFAHAKKQDLRVNSLLQRIRLCSSKPQLERSQEQVYLKFCIGVKTRSVMTPKQNWGHDPKRNLGHDPF